MLTKFGIESSTIETYQPAVVVEMLADEKVVKWPGYHFGRGYDLTKDVNKKRQGIKQFSTNFRNFFELVSNT